MKATVLVTQWCPTLWDPMDCSPPDSNSYNTGVPFPTPGDIHNPGTEPVSRTLADSYTGRHILYHQATRKAWLLEKCKSKQQWGITTSHGSEWPSLKNLQTINAGKGVEKREPSCTVGGNAKRYSHYGRRYGDSLKNQEWNHHMTQQSHCWAYTLRKPQLKKTHVPQCS